MDDKTFKDLLIKSLVLCSPLIKTGRNFLRNTGGQGAINGALRAAIYTFLTSNKEVKNLPKAKLPFDIVPYPIFPALMVEVEPLSKTGRLLGSVTVPMMRAEIDYEFNLRKNWEPEELEKCIKIFSSDSLSAR